MPLAAADLSDELIAHGQHFVTADEIAARLGIEPDRLWGSIHRVIDDKKMVSVTKGGWVPVPPEYRKGGAPPPSHFIDPMMNFLGHPYYIGFLSAAAMHGASHQAPMVFQVATPALLRNRSIGSWRVQFARRAATAERETVRKIVPTGRITVSTPEVTVLDLVESPRLGAGLSNVATVIGDLLLDERLDLDKLALDAHGFSLSVSQRTGHLIDFMAHELGLEVDNRSLHQRITNANPSMQRLRPDRPKRSLFDERWRIEVNTDIEHDL